MAIWPFKQRDPSPFLPVTDPGVSDTREQQPRYVDEAQFQKAMEQVQGMNSKLDQFTGMLTGALGVQAPAQQQQQQAQEPAVVDITDDEYREAVLNGDIAKINTRTEAVAERRARALRKEYEARFQSIETQGMGILDQVNREVGETALKAMPYYALLKTEIDQALATMPAWQRTPEMRQFVYNAKVGENAERVFKFRQEEEARIQKERQSQVDPPGRTAQHDQGPTPESVFGAELLRPDTTWRGGAAVWGRKSPDAWAQSRYGVKDIKEGAVYAANVLALSDCPTCFGPIIGGKCHCRRSA